jgi:hypothetical protein
MCARARNVIRTRRGITTRRHRYIVPANAGIQISLAITGKGPVQPAQTHQSLRGVVAHAENWIPAFAGMTVGRVTFDSSFRRTPESSVCS